MIVLNYFYFLIQTHFDRAIKCLNSCFSQKKKKALIFANYLRLLQSKTDIVQNHLVLDTRREPTKLSSSYKIKNKIKNQKIKWSS